MPHTFLNCGSSLNRDDLDVNVLTLQVDQRGLSKEEVHELKVERMERERDAEQSRFLPLLFFFSCV